MRRAVFGLALVTAVVVPAAVSKADFAYPTFAGWSALDPGFNTSLPGGVLKLITFQPYQHGYVWRTDPENPGAAGGFTSTFTFRYSGFGGGTDANGNVGTEGLLFALREASDAGKAVYMPTTGMAVRFDAFDGGAAEVSSSRVAVFLKETQLAQFDAESHGILFRDQEEHTATVSLAGTTVSVSVDGQVLGAVTDPGFATIGPVYPGLTAWEGVGLAYQDVTAWSFALAPEPSSLGLATVAGAAVFLRRRRGTGRR